MLDHVSLNVTDLAASTEFYERALAPLGAEVVRRYPAAVGIGPGFPCFWLVRREPVSGPAHVAFTAPDRAAVAAFHAAALAAGGRDNGAPGLRPQYHPAYFGAFALDPDGNNVEAVCHRDE